MTYLRVIPRDLFNEGNLLKCYGQLYLNLEKMGLQDLLEHENDDEPFDVRQTIDGELFLGNVTLWKTTEQIERIPLRRPINSRQPFPLWSYDEDENEVQVFNDDGSFTDEMKALLLKGGQP